jgi:hypothetical protein
MPMQGYQYYYRRVGGLRFLRVGVFVFSWCISHRRA